MRCFVAVHLGSSALAEVSRVLEAGRRELADVPVKWVQPGQVHLTLRFLGSVSAADELVKALAGVRFEPFSLELSGVGAFPSTRNPSVLWVGLGGAVEQLQALQSSVEGAVRGFGAHEEKRAFNPHVTLARCRDLRTTGDKERVRPFLSSVTVAAEPWRVESFQLMESLLSPKGAKYRVVESFLAEDVNSKW